MRNTNNKFRKDGFKKNTRNYKQAGVSSEVYAFKTKAERDRYVINEYNVCAITAKQIRRLAGRNFKLEKSFGIPGAYTVEFDRRRLNLNSAKCVLRY